MTDPSDLIRRDSAIDAVNGKAYGDAVDALLALPADPVAEAERKLAELLMSDLDERESMDHDAWDEALTAVRAAVAARDAGKGAKP